MRTFDIIYILYKLTVYMSCSHCLMPKVKLLLEMDRWRNSHSPWDFITSRENWVARDASEKGRIRSSSTEGGSTFQRTSQNKVTRGSHAHSPSSPQCIADPMEMLHFCVSKGNLWTSILQVLTTLRSSSEVTVPSFNTCRYGFRGESSFCILTHKHRSCLKNCVNCSR